MRLQSAASASVRRALAAAAVLTLATACDSPKEPSPAPGGGITVNGSERLAWSQAGDTAVLRFRAYVDDRPVDLDAATCDGGTPDASCSSPLPPLTNGTHTIALVAVDKYSGDESVRSASITVQKVSGTSTMGAVASVGPPGGGGALHLETAAATSDGLTFAADVVANGVKAPVQLAWAPDGRLFVAQSDGSVRIVHPGEADSGVAALDAPGLTEPPPDGPLGLALHPDFPRTHFVYVSFLAQDLRQGTTLLRVIRLREVGDTLGEAATLFEAPLTGTAAEWLRDGPRLAFGPDRLLYVALPPGLEFESEPAASVPVASLLRLRDDGRVPPDLAPLSGIAATPLAFDWHPSTGALWAVFPGDGGEAVLRQVSGGRASGPSGAGTATLHLAAGGERTSGTLLFQRTPDGPLEPPRAFVAVPGNGALAVLTFAEPVRGENLLAGSLGRIGDVVAGNRGALFLATRNGDSARGGEGSAVDVVVRLRRRAR